MVFFKRNLVPNVAFFTGFLLCLVQCASLAIVEKITVKSRDDDGREVLQIRREILQNNVGSYVSKSDISYPTKSYNNYTAPSYITTICLESDGSCQRLKNLRGEYFLQNLYVGVFFATPVVLYATWDFAFSTYVTHAYPGIVDPTKGNLKKALLDPNSKANQK